jgi:GGDEF domain-containing protein
MAADKSAAAAKAAADFARKSGTLDELKSVSFADRLKAAGDALTYQSQFKQVEKFGEVGNLRKRLDPITGQETLHFEEIAHRADGSVISVMRDIPRDAKTQAIDANFEYGHKLAVLTAEKSKGDHLLFIDVNNLGKVNYFKDGTQAGDAYLKAVAAAIRKNLRSDDRFFKNGGDELVVVLKTEKPAEAKAIIERIHRAIDQDRDLQALFRQERAAKAAEIKAATPATKAPTEAQVESLRETAKIRPSVSIGSTRIHGEWKSDLARAEKQAGEIKARYKAEIGLDALKYKVDGLTSAAPKLTAKPAVLDPVE